MPPTPLPDGIYAVPCATSPGIPLSPSLPSAGFLPPPLSPTCPMCEASPTHFTPRPSLPRSTWASEPLCYDSVTLLSDPAGQRTDRSSVPSRPRSILSRILRRSVVPAAASLLSPVVIHEVGSTLVRGASACCRLKGASRVSRLPLASSAGTKGAWQSTVSAAPT